MVFIPIRSGSAAALYRVVFKGCSVISVVTQPVSDNSVHGRPVVNGCAVRLGRHRSGSRRWHALRRKGIGGSEIAAIVGRSPWESAYNLWYRKKGLISGAGTNQAMRWGTLLEPVIYREYATNHLESGLRMTTGETYAHVDRPWQHANPDGLIWDHRGRLVDGLEIKTAGHETHWGPDGTDEIPPWYRCQITWYCDVMGLGSMALRVLIHGNDARTYRVHPTLGDRLELRNAAQKFWDSLATDTPPPIDAHTSTYHTVRQQHPLIDHDGVVELDPDLTQRWWKASAARTASMSEYNLMRNTIAVQMGTARTAQCDGHPVMYRQVSNRTPDRLPYLRTASLPRTGTQGTGTQGVAE